MKLPRRTLLQFVGAAVAAPSLSRIATAQTCSSRRALTLASVFLAGSLNCFFGFSAIAQDAPSEGLKLADDIHETVDKVPVTVTLLSGKTYTGQMIVTHYRPDGPGPFPIVIFNHGRSAAKENAPCRRESDIPASLAIGSGAASQYLCRRGSAMGIAGLIPIPNIPAAIATTAISVCP
jgi:hypothetical protein